MGLAGNICEAVSYTAVTDYGYKKGSLPLVITRLYCRMATLNTGVHTNFITTGHFLNMSSYNLGDESELVLHVL